MPPPPLLGPLFKSYFSENQTESPEECINVYDLANFAEHDDSDLPPRRTFLMDLTSKLSNLNKKTKYQYDTHLYILN